MKKLLTFLIPLFLSLGATAQVQTVPFKSSSARQINISLNDSDVEIIGTNGDNVTITATNFVESDQKLLGDNATGVKVYISGNVMDIKKVSESAASYVIKVRCLASNKSEQLHNLDRSLTNK